jgi:gas vesicle protein
MNNRVYYRCESTEAANRQRLMLVLVALGAGAALALLTAPSSGHETRENLARGLEEGVNKGRETLEGTVKKLESEIADLRKRVDERIKA